MWESDFFGDLLDLFACESGQFFHIDLLIDTSIDL